MNRGPKPNSTHPKQRNKTNKLDLRFVVAILRVRHPRNKTATKQDEIKNQSRQKNSETNQTQHKRNKETKQISWA